VSPAADDACLVLNLAVPVQVSPKSESTCRFFFPSLSPSRHLLRHVHGLGRLLLRVHEGKHASALVTTQQKALITLKISWVKS
jgi:hypothetical protein